VFNAQLGGKSRPNPRGTIDKFAQTSICVVVSHKSNTSVVRI